MKYSLFVVLVAEAERLNFIAFRGFSCFFSEVYFIQRCARRVPLSPEVRISKRKIIF